MSRNIKAHESQGHMLPQRRSFFRGIVLLGTRIAWITCGDSPKDWNICARSCSLEFQYIDKTHPF
ncbi:hypothetical protein M413DRAFT_448487 [Hebeloma cylindrosporum]|uniref:Uncharacterized protein n=1 Tax=Hebeloma cylindrosporum TaxID=76867 RepID=A0A0C2XHT2_HEBCY|nr:hypothetical protein M413DRAFT_448487 [Hebeloma cylindrosporum h7]